MEGIPDGSFVVMAGDVAFSVAIYTITAITAIIILVIRRYVAFFGNAELGGPKVPKWICGCFMFGLWILYGILSSLQAYGHIKSPF